MNEMRNEKARASAWFRALRDEIVAAFEALEDSASSASEVRPGRFVQLNSSFGSAVFPRDGEAYETLLATADKRMYEDKARRKAASRVIGRAQRSKLDTTPWRTRANGAVSGPASSRASTSAQPPAGSKRHSPTTSRQGRPMACAVAQAR